MRGQDPQANVLYEMWSMILHIFRSPPLPISLPTLSQSSPSTSRRPQISTTAFGLLFIGISMSLMLFGILTFIIGFVLMPLVMMLLMLFYFVGIVSKISEIGRAVLWPSTDCTKLAPGNKPHVSLSKYQFRFIVVY